MSADLITLTRYLLPGFLAGWIFYGLCAHQKPEQFERVIQALIFTVIVQGLSAVHALLKTKFFGDHSDSTVTEILPSSYAILIGIVFAWGANRDFLIVYGVEGILISTKDVKWADVMQKV